MNSSLKCGSAPLTDGRVIVEVVVTTPRTLYIFRYLHWELCFTSSAYMVLYVTFDLGNELVLSGGEAEFNAVLFGTLFEQADLVCEDMIVVMCYYFSSVIDEYIYGPNHSSDQGTEQEAKYSFYHIFKSPIDNIPAFTYTLRLILHITVFI